MKCDLHVHTNQSGMCSVPLLDRICRECYNEPLAVYETLKRRGMDLITVTDHDSIGAVEALRSFENFFLSEEVTCRTPDGTELHMGVYGIEEFHHIELQRRRLDLESVLAYLREENLFFTINHVYSSLTGPRTDADFDMFQRRFPGVETRNGQMLAACNRSAARFARQWSKTAVGGSDAHTLSSLGLTWTEVPGATDRREFLAGLLAARSRVQGESGSYAKLTAAVLGIGWSMLRENPWTGLLAPLFAAVPAVTLGIFVQELLFERRWSLRTGVRGAGSLPTVCDSSSPAVS